MEGRYLFLKIMIETQSLLNSKIFIEHLEYMKLSSTSWNKTNKNHTIIELAF
jgi:hypothetical protein